ncbi:YhcB family protein [Teredinibacter turnerae]|uniref:YhcB family protein n=1 Tax=Teredinibacter turnerae TaxID=2426 RepID=UPI000363B625|nr:YhcB family protein [Teredinibacter turnerae]
MLTITEVILFSLETLIMVCAIVLCVGALLGALISRTFLPPEQKRDLEQSLQLTRQELSQYQQDVAQHFAETSKLVHNLTQSYKEVHEHLAKGAVELTNSEISRKIIAAGEGTLNLEGTSIEGAAVEPPKDWAPKTPGESGTLSEDYGHDEEEPVHQPPHVPVPKKAG